METVKNAAQGVAGAAVDAAQKVTEGVTGQSRVSQGLLLRMACSSCSIYHHKL
jgi:hypothetical protein